MKSYQGFRTVPIQVTFLFMLMFPLVGCTQNEFVEASYKTLKSCDTLYVSCMEAVSDAQSKGFITDDQRRGINEKAHIYLDSFRAATTALYAYVALSSNDKGAVIEAIDFCTETVKGLLTYATENGVNMVGSGDIS